MVGRTTLTDHCLIKWPAMTTAGEEMCLCGSILMSIIWHILNCNTHNLPVSLCWYCPIGVWRCGTKWLMIIFNLCSQNNSTFQAYTDICHVVKSQVRRYNSPVCIICGATKNKLSLNMTFHIFLFAACPANVPQHEIVKPFLHIWFSLRTESVLLAPVSKLWKWLMI